MDKTTTPRRVAALAVAAVGVIHLVLAPEYLEEAAYIGVLFIVGGLAAIAAGVRMWVRYDPLATTLAVLISVGMGVGFVLSRTVGLPGFREAEWELSGIVCLGLEALVVILAPAAIGRRRHVAAPR